MKAERGDMRDEMASQAPGMRDAVQRACPPHMLPAECGIVLHVKHPIAPTQDMYTTASSTFRKEQCV